MNLERHISNFEVAWTAILSNTFRAILTALGIIFGVAAVIAMLAIGNGAQKELLDQMKLIGVNNVEITSFVPETDDNDNKNSKFSPGLTFNDIESIKLILPNLERISPEIEKKEAAMANGQKVDTKIVGVGIDYLAIKNFKIEQGQNFSSSQLNNSDAVCIIGKSVEAKLFGGQNSVGKNIKCGQVWLKIIGVLANKIVSQNAKKELGIRDVNLDIYIPTKTMLVRFENRGFVNKYALDKASESSSNNGMMGGGEKQEEKETIKPNYHQIDKIIVQVEETEQLSESAEIISRILKRKHNQLIDFEVSVPEQMLKQQQKTKEMFKIVLGAIAGISLIVGGIGIMNIMLASVYERIKEIGLRIALGAYKSDIVSQFLYESVLISITGGLIGVFLGVAISLLVKIFFGIETIISGVSVFLSFSVAVSIGLLFGIMPARKAAKQDPITSLRHE